MLGGLGDRPLGLSQRAVRSLRRLDERLPEGADQERVALLVEREGSRLARAAHDTSGGGGESP
jgi:hypothetical protein